MSRPPKHPLVDKSAYDIVGAVVLFQRISVSVPHDPVGFDPADRIFHTDPNPGLWPVDLPLFWGEPFARLAPDWQHYLHVRVYLLRSLMPPVPILPQVRALSLSGRAVLARQVRGERWVFRLVHLEVVYASWGVPGVVDDQAVNVHGILRLGCMSSSLARIVGSFHVLALRSLYRLL